MKAESGAKRVVVFDHTLRTADDAARATQDPRSGPARPQRLHRVVGPQRVRDLFCRGGGGVVAAALRHHSGVAADLHPVETFPLAICDAQSVSFDDFVISERRYPNRVGQTYAVKYNPAHRWYWFPRMRP